MSGKRYESKKKGQIKILARERFSNTKKTAAKAAVLYNSNRNYLFIVARNSSLLLVPFIC